LPGSVRPETAAAATAASTALPPRLRISSERGGTTHRQRDGQCGRDRHDAPDNLRKQALSQLAFGHLQRCRYAATKSIKTINF